jgi:HlyD family secretion protein
LGSCARLELAKNAFFHRLYRRKDLKKKVILIVFLALLVGVGGLVYYGQYRRRTAEVYYSGTVEAARADLSFQVSGRVEAVLVDEGHAVKQNQILARLDPTEFIAHRDKADAELSRAFETFAQAQVVLDLNRSVLPAEVSRAEAAVQALESQLNELQSGFRSQDVETVRLAYETARMRMQDAGRDKDRYDNLYARRIVAEKDRDAVTLKYETALRAFEQARASYALAREGYRREKIETARARLAEGRVLLQQARSNLKKIEVYSRDVNAAQAMIRSARSALNLSKIQLNYAVLKSPFDGKVTSRNVEPGEVVSPRREVLSVADLTRVDLKIFVSETEIGKVKHGQRVEVKIDTFPDKTYTGRVSFISPEAEFTPKIIQTRKERVKLVYLVKVSIPNPEYELKPGMPADAWLR